MTQNNETLLKIEKWLRVLAFDKIRTKVESLSPEEKRIYDLSTENNTTRDIGKQVGIGHTTVNAKQKEWFGQGIMDASPVQRGTRYIHMASLSELGIEVSEVKK